MLRLVNAIRQWLSSPRNFALVRYEENSFYSVSAAESLEDLDREVGALVADKLGDSSADPALFRKAARTIYCGNSLRTLICRHRSELDDMILYSQDKLSSPVVEYLNSPHGSEEFRERIQRITNHVPDLRYKDIAAFRDEASWLKQPKTLFGTIIITSIAAAIQGWDQTGSNGANLIWPAIFGVSVEGCGRDNPPSYCATNTLIVGFVNSAPYIAITFLASWISEPLNFLCGRRISIFIGALFGITAPLVSTRARSWGALFGYRLLLGFGMGIKEVTVPIFAAEIAPPEIRGALVMSWQLWTAFGILLGSVANVFALDNVDDLNVVWQYQLGSAFIPAVPLLLYVMFAPESPRWLMKKGRHEEAFRSLERLRGKHKILAAREFLYLQSRIQQAQDEEDQGFASNDGPWTFFHIKSLMKNRRTQSALIAAFIVMASQQLCGINILSFFSSNIFSELVHRPTRKGRIRLALVMTIVFGAINFALGWLAFATIDRYGRRRLLLATFPLMAFFLVMAGGLHDHLKAMSVFVYLFAAAYSPGPGPIAFTYSAEVFPIENREAGMGWAVAVNNLLAAILSIFFLRMYDYFPPKGSGVFVFFAGMNLLAAVLVFLYVPDSSQQTLEALNAIFELENARYIQHAKANLRWLAQRPRGSKPRLYDFPLDRMDENAPVQQ